MRRPAPKPAPSVDEVLDQAQSLLGLKQYAKAGRIAEKILESHPHNEQAAEIAAIVAIRHEQPGRAIELLERAGVAEFETPMASLLLANACHWTGEIGREAEVLRRTIRRFPQCAMAWAHYGDVVWRSEADFRKAKKYFVKAMKLDPEEQGTFRNFGIVALEHGDLRLAKALLQEASRLGSSKARLVLEEYSAEFDAIAASPLPHPKPPVA